jgi:hypothetical protein
MNEPIGQPDRSLPRTFDGLPIVSNNGLDIVDELGNCDAVSPSQGRDELIRSILIVSGAANGRSRGTISPMNATQKLRKGGEAAPAGLPMTYEPLENDLHP